MLKRVINSNTICNSIRATNGVFSTDTSIRNMSAVSHPVESSIRNKLTTNLNMKHLEVINESYMHNVPKDSETHFKIVVVADLFKDMALIKRHRLINDLLKDELKNTVHALSIVAKTPEQWDNSNKKVEPSPACRGGFGK